MAHEHPRNITARLWTPSVADAESRIYAILDAARDPAIYPAVVQSDLEYCSLYRGEAAEELAEVAPYLVSLREETRFTQWLVDEGWGQSWGVFLESKAAINELRRHFRRFLMVYDSTGKPLYFRYYDPRVLRLYLPTCNEGELQTLFGPVTRYCLESDDGRALVEYRFHNGRLTERAAELVQSDHSSR
jgi:hypothetical protein